MKIIPAIFHLPIAGIAGSRWIGAGNFLYSGYDRTNEWSPPVDKYWNQITPTYFPILSQITNLIKGNIP